MATPLHSQLDPIVRGVFDCEPDFRGCRRLDHDPSGLRCGLGPAGYGGCIICFVTRQDYLGLCAGEEGLQVVDVTVPDLTVLGRGGTD